MSDEINAFFQLIEGWLGFHPATIAAIALTMVLVLAALSFYLLVRLRNSRGIVHQLAGHLGYEPPFGDGEEIRQQEFRNELVQRAREMKVKRLEQRVAELEGEASTRDSSLAAFQQRYTELDDQLQQASLRQKELTTQAGERTQAHQSAIAQLEQRLLDMEAEGYASRSEFQRRSSELEDQLQQATVLAENEKSSACQELDGRNTRIERLELQVRDLEAEIDVRNSGLKTLQALVNNLQEELQQASLRHQDVAAQAAGEAHAHQNAIDQFEQRRRDFEAESYANLAELEHRSKGLEDQLQQAHLRHQELIAQSNEQAQAHHQTVDQFEQRLRDLEAQGNTSLSALQQHSRELEDQLQQLTLQTENEKSTAYQETLEQIAGIERLEQRVRDHEAEIDARESALKTLQARVTELEGQLQHLADQAAETILAVHSAPPPAAERQPAAPDTSSELLRRAEWITACAVGAIRPLGLVAAEAYAAAAIAADPHNLDARRLLVELAKLRSASPKPLPSVVEAVTTFDDAAAAFFGPNLARAADFAEKEARQRYQAGLSRAALPVVNLALALRRHSAADHTPDTLRLNEMKASLLARLGSNAKPSSQAPKLASL